MNSPYYFHTTEEQDAKAHEAAYGKPESSQTQTEDVSKSAALIQPQVSNDTPSPIVPVIDMMVRTPEENIQADKNAAHTGIWSQTGYVPTPSAQEEIINDMWNPATQLAATGIAAEVIGPMIGAGAIGSVFTRVGSKVTELPIVGKGIASILEKIGGSAIGKTIGNTFTSGVYIPMGRLGQLEIPAKDIISWSLAGTGVDVGTRAIEHEPINIAKITEEQFLYTAGTFIITPIVLHGFGFTISKSAKGLGFAISKGFNAVDNLTGGWMGQYIKAGVEAFQKTVAPISPELVNGSVNALYKSSHAEREEAKLIVGYDFPDLMKDPDFLTATKSVAKFADYIIAGNEEAAKALGFTEEQIEKHEVNPFIRGLEDGLEGSPETIAQKLDTKPMAHATYELILKLKNGIPEEQMSYKGKRYIYEFFNTPEAKKAVNNILTKYKDLLDLHSGELSKYWIPFNDVYRGFKESLPSEFYDSLKAGDEEKALSYVENEGERAFFKKKIEEMKANGSGIEYILDTLATANKMIYKRSIGEGGEYLTRTSLQGTNEIEMPPGVNASFDSIDNMLKTYDNSLMSFTLDELKERRYKTMFERILDDPGISYKNGWGLQRTVNFSIQQPALLWDFANWLEHLEAGGKDAVTNNILAGGDFGKAVENYMEKGNILKDGVYMVSDIQKTTNPGAAALSVGEKVKGIIQRIRILFYPTVSDKKFFVDNLNDIYTRATGETMLKNHYTEINFGKGAKLIDKHYADFVSRLFSSIRGETPQVLAPLKGFTKGNAALKSTKLTLSVIHFGAIMSAALGVKHGKLAAKTFGGLINHAFVEKDAAEWVKEQNTNNAKVYINFLREHPELEKDQKILSLLNAPAEVAELKLLQEVVRSFSGSDMARIVGKVPGVGGFAKVLGKGAKALTFDMEYALWNYFVPLVKGGAVRQIIEKGEKAGASPEEIYRQLTTIQDAIGGQAIWHSISPEANALIRLLAFAPDWYVTLTKHVTRMMDGTPEFAMFIPRITATAGIIANSISIAFTGQGTVDRFLVTHDLKDLGRIPIPVLVTSPNGTRERKIIYLDIFGFQTEGLEFLGILPLANAAIKYFHTTATDPVRGMRATVIEAWDDWSKFIMSKIGLPIQPFVQAGEHVKTDPLGTLISTTVFAGTPIAGSSFTRLLPYTTSKDPMSNAITNAELFALTMMGARLRTSSQVLDELYTIWATNTTTEQKRRGVMPSVVNSFLDGSANAFKNLGLAERGAFKKDAKKALYKRYIKAVYNIDVSALASNPVLRQQVMQQARQDSVLKDLLHNANPGKF
jgi:hypothetical protein